MLAEFLSWSRAIVAAHWEQLAAAGVPTLLITVVAATWRSQLLAVPETRTYTETEELKYSLQLLVDG